MFRFLHQFTGFLFYVSGLSLFVAYLLMTNKIFAMQSAWWLQRVDLPFALVAILYGGTSLYRSLNLKEKPAPILATAVAVPLVVFFIFLVVLNFWEVLPFPQGEVMM